VRAILVRIGVDQAFGGWNAPVNPKTGEFVFVPIPDGAAKRYPEGYARSYEEVEAAVSDFATKHLVPDVRLPDPLRPRKMHLDPDFECLTYGDNGSRRGAGVATLVDGDVLAFYAGLRSVLPPRKLVYALVGAFVVGEVIRAADAPAERLHENAHTRWTPISDDDVIVRGKAGVSGRFSICIPIGEWRDGAYRVRRDVEAAWGGLGVKNGFIQRSAVPPEFKDAARFGSWLQEQGVDLVERNN